MTPATDARDDSVGQHMAPPKIVLVDADGVVQLPAPTWRPTLQALCPNPQGCDEFLADIFAAEAPCLTGSVDFEAALAEVLARWNVDVSLADTMRTWTQIEPDQDVLLMNPMSSQRVVVG